MFRMLRTMAAAVMAVIVTVAAVPAWSADRNLQ